MNTPITRDMKASIIDSLDDMRVPFRTFWNICDIYFTDEVKTAMVTCYNENIAILINETFWKSLSERGQLFVLCHEQLHVMSNHFNRMKFNDGKNTTLKNIAADLSINHALINHYGFKKEDLADWKNYCWIETIFPHQAIPDNETCEFYYMLLISQSECDNCTKLTQDSFDDHSMGDDVSEKYHKKLQEYIDNNTKEMSEKEKQKWIEELEEVIDEYSQSLDTEGMGNTTQTHAPKVTPDNNWKAVYKNIPKSLYKAKTRSHWISRQRNHLLLPDDLMLPTDWEDQEEHVVRCHVYLDSSGSCINHAQHFLESSLSLPKKMFDITFFGFGTKVYELQKTPPYALKGFRNESYAAVSQHVDSCRKKLDAVLVFTDGFSRKVTPKNPEKWYWFITPKGSHNYIDPRCNVYDLDALHWKGQR